MLYISTRGTAEKVTSGKAILNGIAPDGGLYVPEEFPFFTENEISSMTELDYPGLCARILKRFLTDYNAKDIERFCVEAYCAESFPVKGTAPVIALDGDRFVLELFHGPSCAFKDFALQLLPRLMSEAMRMYSGNEKVIILTATSGDTGKAALEGFKDVKNTGICVFYPHGGVSDVQRLQMTTQKGGNVFVSAVHGNFDDTQTGVKAIFGDVGFARKLKESGYVLSSANSINWGRLVPQIAYYFAAYCALLMRGAVTPGEKIDFCVPTGNFGDILAGYYAKKCGLPVRKLVCASNENRVLTDFLETGVYDAGRAFIKTASPSMDILISSNLERLLFDVASDPGVVRDRMKELKEKHVYRISAGELAGIRETFEAGSTDDSGTKDEIGKTWAEHHYLADTHTAVALRVDRNRGMRDGTKTVIVSTASPYKFAASVLEGLGKAPAGSGSDSLIMLSGLTGTDIPRPLRDLDKNTERFTGVVEKSNMTGVVEAFGKSL